MLVGEAPGRFGAARTGVPFLGDASGKRLDVLLDAAGWQRDAVFLTNAVLCGPIDQRGHNRPPTAGEIRNCSHWLARQIEIIDPLLVVGMGAVALRALSMVAPHSLTVRDAGAGPVRWHGRWLAAVYHPGARAAIHREVSRQHCDFQRLGRFLDDISDERAGFR